MVRIPGRVERARPAGCALRHNLRRCLGEYGHVERAVPPSIGGHELSERILLAGCGDLGLRVARRLHERGDEVWALRRTQPADPPGFIRWVRADLTVPWSLRDLPKGLTQLVYMPAPDRFEAHAYRA